MKADQKRLLDEQKELSAKIISLTTFITDFDKTKLLSENGFASLRRQLDEMLEADRLLRIRIDF